jgi:hypothetical protein
MHPKAEVPVTVYVVVLLGDAMGLLIVEDERSEVGVQLYVVAPLADKFTFPPAQNASGIPASTMGVGLTVIVTLALAAHAVELPGEVTM